MLSWRNAARRPTTGLRKGQAVNASRHAHAIAMGTIVILAGLLPLSALPMRAQPAAWECPAPATAGDTTGASAPIATPPAPVPFPGESGNLTVFAAASLTDAFEAMQADLREAHPNLTITYNFGGSQALVTQLVAGASADVLASANAAQMDTAVDAGVVSSEPVTFIRNRLAVVTPADNPAAIASAADLGKSGLRLVLAQPEVPAGRYAREAICRMAGDTAAYGDDFLGRVTANLVSEEEDVRDVLAKVQLGEADAGIVYVSDATAGGSAVRNIPIPDDVNVVASYPVAAVTGGDQSLAAAFIAFLLGPDGQATLAAHGFTPVA
jgi:molybdate transport system substrate-binding protein